MFLLPHAYVTLNEGQGRIQTMATEKKDLDLK